jgi:hypothetical protein
MIVQRLHNLWRALESIPGASATGAEWRLRLGDDFESLKSLLLPTDQLATTIPDANDPYASYRVVRHAADDIVGIHDGDGSTIALSKLDVLIYDADIVRIAKSAVAALAWEPTVEGNNLAYPLRIGTARPSDTPVFLAIPHDPSDLLHAVEILAAKHVTSFVLLTPTARFMRPTCEELLKTRAACFLPLIECIEVQDGNRWVASQLAVQKLSIFLQSQVRLEVSASPPNGKSRREKATQNRKSWTQVDLDAAIREYKARRAANYGELVEAVKAGRPGAKKAAQNMFGRNAIARELGVKAPAMVTKSPDWQQLADELGLSRGKDRNVPKRKRVGLDIALEESAAKSQPVLELAVRQETVQLVKSSMSQSEANAVVDRLQRGEITDDQARDLIELVKDQKREARTRRVRSNL